MTVVDLRRFEYPLEPIRRQRQWRLEACTAELGRSQQELDEAEQALRAAQRRLADETLQTARAADGRLDPVRYPREIRWLVHLREQVDAGARRVQELRARRDEARAACARQQQQVEVIERHYSETVGAFAQQEEARAVAEADRDWLARQERLESGREGGDR